MPRGSVPQRTVLPLILAIAGVCAALTTQGQWWTALALLFCPGWGISRILSRANRGFGLAGSSLCLSFLVLAAIPVVSTTAWINLDQDQMGPLLLAIMLILVLLGMNQLQRWDRWKAKQPPPHQPMPAWPSRTFACLIVLGLALVALVFAEPFGVAKSGTLHLWEAGRAMGWTRGGENPFLAGTPLPINGVLSAATAGLFLASGIHPVIGVQLLMASALTAVLFHIAEGISRLWGNIGGLRAMLAFLLGLNPLASFFLLGAQHRGEILPSLSPGFDDGLTVALQPFLEGSQLSLTLAFTAMLLSCTLSTLRRASYHVPRLAGAAAFGLAVTSPPTMLLLLPAWIVGIAMSHVACRHHPDNDPNPGNPIRRAGEPLLLRSPFWRPVIPIVVGGCLGLLLADPVQPSLMPARPVAWAILASVGPACLLFMPGIRHLNASPGREAFFFSGIVTLVAATAMSIDLYGDQGEHAVRILSLLLAIPCANGVIKMIEIHRSRARTILSAMVVFLVPAQIAVVYEHAQRPVTLAVNMESGVSPASQITSPKGNRIEILQKVSLNIPVNAVMISDEFRSPASREIATLVTGRSLLGQRVGQTGSHRWEREAELRRALVKRLALGDGTALAALRNLTGLSAREFWTETDTLWPGFTPTPSDPQSLQGNLPPNIVLVTVPGLRQDSVNEKNMPGLDSLAKNGVRFDQAITPFPSTTPGLVTFLTGLSPSQHRVNDSGGFLPREVPTLDGLYKDRGYRTLAAVSLPPEWLEGYLHQLGRFDAVATLPGGTATEIVNAAVDQLAVADSRPVFLWVHLSDLIPPLIAPNTNSLGNVDITSFPEDGDVEAIAFAERADEDGDLLPDAVDLTPGLAIYADLLTLIDLECVRIANSLGSDDLLIVTAPHGMSLQEHRSYFDYGRDLFEPSVRVPLLMVGGGMPSLPYQRLTSLADIGTFLLQGKLPQRERVNLVSRYRPGKNPKGLSDPARAASSRGPEGQLWGERSVTTKVILLPGAGQNQPPVGVAWDLVADPEELHPLPADQEALTRLLEHQALAGEVTSNL